MAAHRYWSFYITDTQDADVALIKAAIAEIELRASLGGADQTGSGVAIQSVGVGANAFDDNNGTDWDSVFGNSLPQRVGYDFGLGNDIDIVEVAITATAGSPGVAPGQFDIQWSDDNSAWTTAKSYTGEINWTAGEQRLFSSLVSPSGQSILTLQHTPVAPSGKSVLRVWHLPQQIGKTVLTLQHTPVAPSGKSILAVQHNLIATGKSALSVRHQPNAAMLGRQWTLVVMLDGVDVSASITGQIRTKGAKGAARLAFFVMRPSVGPIDAQEWVKKPVSIDYVTLTGGVVQTRHRRYTGKVNDATYDPDTKLISFECSDQLQDSFEGADFSWVDTIIGGYHSPAVFNEVDNGWEYAQQRLESQPVSYDKDVNGVGRKWDWGAKGVADVVLSEAEIINDSLTLTQATARDIINHIDISLGFRYPRKWQRETVAAWVFPVSFHEYLRHGPRMPNRQMFLSALGSGWKIKHVSFTKAPPSGVYDGVEWSIRESVRNELIMGANATVAARWLQDVVEQYSMVVKCQASIDEFGQIKAAASYSIEAPEEPAHEDALNDELISATGSLGSQDTIASTDYQSPEAGSVAVGNGDHYLDSTNRSDFDNAIQTAIAVARVDILDSHHSTELAVDILVDPEIDIGSTVEVATTDDSGRGTVGGLVEVYDLDAGSAIATVVVDVYAPNVAGQADSPVAVPASPVVLPFVGAPSISLPTHIGGELDDWLTRPAGALPSIIWRATEPADPDWRGLLTNYTLVRTPAPDAVFYPFEFRIESPAVEAELRDEQTFEATVALDVAIPQELLTINA